MSEVGAAILQDKLYLLGLGYKKGTYVMDLGTMKWSVGPLPHYNGDHVGIVAVEEHQRIFVCSDCFV
jgi:hypothetical protein